MKILITTDWYKPVINGVVTSVINLMEGLVKDGHEVRILTLSNSSHSRKEENVYYISSVGAGIVYPNARVMLPLGHKYVEELIEWKPDVIHSQCEFSTFILAKKIAKRTGTPIIHTYHTVYEGYTHYFCPSKVCGKKMVEMFSRRIASHTQAMVVPSAKISDLLEGYRVSTPLYVIPSGIKLERFMDSNYIARDIIREKLGIERDECILIYLGRLAKEKNLEEIIEFLSESKMQKARLIIVGDGPYRVKLEEKAKECKVENRIIFAGMVPPNRVQDYYKAGDIFVSASTSETQGLTYMEAMASGLPILCRYDKCLDDVVIQGRNGYTYTNQKEFETYLSELYSNSITREKIGNEARETMKLHFSIQAFAGACEVLYRQCNDQGRDNVVNGTFVYRLRKQFRSAVM